MAIPVATVGAGRGRTCRRPAERRARDCTASRRRHPVHVARRRSSRKPSHRPRTRVPLPAGTTTAATTFGDGLVQLEGEGLHPVVEDRLVDVAGVPTSVRGHPLLGRGGSRLPVAGHHGQRARRAEPGQGGQLGGRGEVGNEHLRGRDRPARRRPPPPGPALPLLSTTTRRAPSPAARPIIVAAPRALNDPVGRCCSILTHSPGRSSRIGGRGLTEADLFPGIGPGPPGARGSTTGPIRIEQPPLQSGSDHGASARAQARPHLTQRSVQIGPAAAHRQPVSNRPHVDGTLERLAGGEMGDVGPDPVGQQRHDHLPGVGGVRGDDAVLQASTAGGRRAAAPVR